MPTRFRSPLLATEGLHRYLLALSVTAACGTFTDSATRVAYDLEGGARRLRSSPERTLTVEHVPKATPEGCSGDYTLQLSQESALLVWCQDSIGGPSSSSHTTTYHLNYVGVPQTLLIHKHAGEHTLIELKKDGDVIVVSGLR